ncbi:MAG TPA: DUF1287 domain-containing protein [Hyphomicrobium sp.]|nr:DUF1287 domain-containing protein [Hyphomicrobium sp.]HRO49846.1 DUF1287 domain-containing protein [Hyphomicrobium sp.]
MQVSARRGLSGLASFKAHVSPGDLRARLDHWRTASRAIALPYSRDERQILLLLFLPVLLVASAIVVHQSMRTLYAYVTLAATHGPGQEVTSLRPEIAKTALPPAAEVTEPSTRASIARETAMPATPLHPLAGASPALVPSLSPPAIRAAASAEPANARPVSTPGHLSPSADEVATLPETIAPAADTPPTDVVASLALPAPAPTIPLGQPRIAPQPIETFEANEWGQPILPGICTVADAERNAPLATSALPVSTGAPLSLSPEAFGLRLAEAAEAQTAGFVVYDDAYRSIAYPMGDVHHMFGVCTDVVVRAYRTLGIDLQALVHQTRSGRGDRNIDHRRTEVLRRFFAVHGESLPISSFAEDYRPGDIVTYHRPQNRGSRSHIAVVSSEIAPSGRPMIVHNRGWGPQLEDALFVDRITGHYRYRGPTPVQEAAANPSPAGGITAAALPVSLPAPAN